MRLPTAGLAILMAVTACGDPFHDPVELVRARAPLDALDCGHVGWNSEVTVAAARACAVTALAAGRPFQVVVDAPVADGRLTIGWIGTSVGGEQLTYDAVVGPLCDDETIAWRSCARLVDRGDGCDSLADDLCLACE